MIQEYLFEKKEQRQEMEKYQWDSCKKTITDFEHSNCWVVSFYNKGENKKSAKILSSLHKEIIDKFNPIVITNESAAYYNKLLYPYFNEFERKLRKLLYLKSALNEEDEKSSLIKNLEIKDLGQIFSLLFIDKTFVKDVSSEVNNKNKQFTKEEIIETIKEIQENTLWDKIIGKEAVSTLRLNFMNVKMYRNDTMHAHSMDTTTYNKAYKLIKKINEQIDNEINKIVGIKDAEVSESKQNFNVLLGEALKEMNYEQNLKTLQENIERLSEINTINTASVGKMLTTCCTAIENSGIQDTAQLLNSQTESLRKYIQDINDKMPYILKELTEKVALINNNTIQNSLKNIYDLQNSNIYTDVDVIEEKEEILTEGTTNGKNENGNG